MRVSNRRDTGGHGPTDSADVRRHNLALVSRYLRDHGPAARSEIATGTGLVRGTLTAIVVDLQNAGLVREAPARADKRQGRPLTRLELDGSRSAVLAVHVGSESIDLIAVDLAERRLARYTVPHSYDYEKPPTVADQVAELIRSVSATLGQRGHAICQIVVVMAGPVFAESEVVGRTAASGSGWAKVDFAGLLRERLTAMDAPIHLVNNANMAALAEWYAARSAGDSDLQNMAYITPDDGIGGGLISEGRLFLGAYGLAFEPGHVVVDFAGAECVCGQRGCLATVAGPEFVVAAAGLQDVADAYGIDRALAELRAQALAGEGGARDALRAAGRWVGRILPTIAILTDTERIVLGGMWAELYEPIVAGISESWDMKPLINGSGPAYRPDGVKFVTRGRLGGEAPLIGAYRHAIDLLLDDPLAIAHAESPISL